MPDYARALNEAQYAAVTSAASATLVIAGAGSGKTRTIVWRLAWLIEQGITPEEILLLTFTRKASAEMLARASNLLENGNCGAMVGGTFHSFAYSSLRRWSPEWLDGRKFTLLDQADIAHALHECRDNLKLGRKDSSFPKSPLIASILSKARNKETSIGEVLQRDYFHLLPHADSLEKIGEAYANYKRQNALLDYDDLLFELEVLLKGSGRGAQAIRERFKHILVDEYQDTNLVQSRLVQLLACNGSAHVMAVGDEAQSIYGFRGANVNNILNFPAHFPNTNIVRLEENYRSTQPILDVANSILAHAERSFNKHLFTKREGGAKARLICPLTDASQANIAVQRIQELLNQYLPHEIAVLFRSGFHSYPLETALRKAGINFQKYGGLKLVEASHIKDVLSFARLVINPVDHPAFNRLAAMHKGIGPKTAAKLHKIMCEGNHEKFFAAFKRYPDLLDDLRFIDELRAKNIKPAPFLEETLNHFRSRLEELYPEDWPRRLAGLEELLQMAQNYGDLDLFVADLALESPENDAREAEDSITLSTIHSAKGLEWEAVLIIDLVEDRFPSRHAQARPEDYEEERRLFYVACTRARKSLDLFAPSTIFNQAQRAHTRVAQSPFLREISAEMLDIYQEKYDGVLTMKSPSAIFPQPAGDYGAISPEFAPDECKRENVGANQEDAKGGKKGYCRHKLFGRGKIIKILDDDKVQVNFPGFGLKVILKDYLLMENGHDAI